MSEPQGTAPHVAGQLAFLACVANDDHSRTAARFAALRARNSRGRLDLLHVVAPPEFQHWAAVGALMREEIAAEGRALLESVATEVGRFGDVSPRLHLREGPIGEEILRHLASDPSINVLVVGAAPPDAKRGSLISWLAGQLAGQLRIPLVIVPGTLSDTELQDLT
ncbi:MAG: universal stress protein [Alphaproteobacteria bacterium]|nr:universal stress protein [Alphaproteobacteria bacterium]